MQPEDTSVLIADMAEEMQSPAALSRAGSRAGQDDEDVTRAYTPVNSPINTAADLSQTGPVQAAGSPVDRFVPGGMTDTVKLAAVFAAGLVVAAILGAAFRSGPSESALSATVARMGELHAAVRQAPAPALPTAAAGLTPDTARADEEVSDTPDEALVLDDPDEDEADEDADTSAPREPVELTPLPDRSLKSPDDVLAEARKAQAAGKHRTAYGLASQVYRRRGSSSAGAVMTVSACTLGDAKRAAADLAKVNADGRDAVRSQCQTLGIALD